MKNDNEPEAVYPPMKIEPSEIPRLDVWRVGSSLRGGAPHIRTSVSDIATINRSTRQRFEAAQIICDAHNACLAISPRSASDAKVHPNVRLKKEVLGEIRDRLGRAINMIADEMPDKNCIQEELNSAYGLVEGLIDYRPDDPVLNTQPLEGSK